MKTITINEICKDCIKKTMSLSPISVLILSLLLLIIPSTQAQEIEVESVYEISGKAKRGELQNVIYGDDGYKLSYVIRSSKKKIVMEHYTFDNDFRFQNVEEEEIELEKAKGKYKWFKGREEGERKKLLRVENNMTGQIVLKEGYFVYKCDYYNGVCWWDFKPEERTKPKDESGRKLTLMAYRTDEPQTSISYTGWSWTTGGVTKSFSDATGDVTIVCSVLAKIKDYKAGGTLPEPYTIMRISVDDNTIKKELDFGAEEFEGKPQKLVFQSNLFNGNIGLVFAPMGGAGMKKTQDPDPLNWRYIEIDPKSVEIVKSVPIASLNSYWRISAIAAWGDDIYIYGPAENKKNDKYANLLSGEKFNQFSMAKISGQKVEWVTNTNLDEFKEKLKAPPNQKKAPEYVGKKFTIGAMTISKSGDIFISGQNYKPSNDGNQYLDIFAFQFNNKGSLKSQYGIHILEKNKYAKTQPTTSLFRESSDGKSMSWNILEIAGYKSMGNERPLMYARISEIDIENAEVKDFISLGIEGKDKYYLEDSYPILPTTVGGDKLTYFGSDKAGKEIWFCRVSL